MLTVLPRHLQEPEGREVGGTVEAKMRSERPTLVSYLLACLRRLMSSASRLHVTSLTTRESCIASTSGLAYVLVLIRNADMAGWMVCKGWREWKVDVYQEAKGDGNSVGLCGSKVVHMTDCSRTAMLHV